MSERLNSIQLTAREAKLAYNPRLDTEAFSALNVLKNYYTAEEFESEKEKLLELTRTNLITSLAERLNVEIYKTEYQMRGGSIYHSEFYQDTPFLEVVRTGQQVRQRAGSTEVKRESAEVEGFEKVQFLLSNEADPQTKVIMISPRGDDGSIYGHNFFDVYQKNESGKILMSRYSSKSTKEEFKKSADHLDPQNQIPTFAQDSHFLKNPILTKSDNETILKTLNLDGSTMTNENFQALLPHLEPQIQNILSDLDNSHANEKLSQKYNALLKSADILAGLDENFEANNQTVNFLTCSPNEAALMFGSLPIREVRTGCGVSANNTPFSVSEFATGAPALFSKSNEDQYGTLEIHCDECGARYNRSPGQLEKNCRHCGGVKGIAC